MRAIMRECVLLLAMAYLAHAAATRLVTPDMPTVMTRSSALAELLRSRSILISDGGLATELESRGGEFCFERNTQKSCLPKDADGRTLRQLI